MHHASPRPMKLVGLLGLLMLPVLAGMLIAQPALAAGGPYAPLGQLGGGTPMASAISGDYAYVAAYGVLAVVDVSDRAHPQPVAYYDTPGSAQDVVVSGSYAYVADDAAGLRIISIADPLHPVEVGSCDTPGLAWRVKLAGNYA